MIIIKSTADMTFEERSRIQTLNSFIVARTEELVYKALANAEPGEGRKATYRLRKTLRAMLADELINLAEDDIDMKDFCICELVAKLNTCKILSSDTLKKFII